MDGAKYLEIIMAIPALFIRLRVRLEIKCIKVQT